MIDRKELRGKLTSTQIEESLRREIAIIRILNHPCIVKLHEALEDESSLKIYLVMDYCSKGSLLSPEYWKAQSTISNTVLDDELTGNLNKKLLNFVQAKKYFLQSLIGLNYSTYT